MFVNINNRRKRSQKICPKISIIVILRSGATKESFEFCSKAFFYIILETTEIIFWIASAGAGVFLIQHNK